MPKKIEIEFSKIDYSLRHNDAVHTTYAYAETRNMSFGSLCREVQQTLGLANKQVVSMIVRATLQEAAHHAANGYRVDLADVMTLYPVTHMSMKDEYDEKTGKYTPVAEDKFRTDKHGVELHAEVRKHVNKTFREEVRFNRVEHRESQRTEKNRRKAAAVNVENSGITTDGNTGSHK